MVRFGNRVALHRIVFRISTNKLVSWLALVDDNDAWRCNQAIVDEACRARDPNGCA
jgi:hypothetical protein